MPSRRWADSTESLATSLGGALQNDYTMRSGRSQPEHDPEWETTDEPYSLVGWLQDIESGQLKHVVAFSPITTAGEYVLPLNAIRRVMCHLVLNRLPDRALPEVWESLNQMAEFYSYEPTRKLIAGEGQQLKAAIVGSRPRPVFTIDE